MQATRRKWAGEGSERDSAHPPLPVAPGPPHRPLSSAPGAWGDRFLFLWTGPGLLCGHRDAYPCSASARESPRPRQNGADPSRRPWHGTVREGLLAPGPFSQHLPARLQTPLQSKTGLPRGYCLKDKCASCKLGAKSNRGPCQQGRRLEPGQGFCLTSLAAFQELGCLQQDLDVAGHGFHVGNSWRRASRS